MSNYQTMNQGDIYNPDQPMYQAGNMAYELPKNMMQAYNAGGSSECSGVISVPTSSMLP